MKKAERRLASSTWRRSLAKAVVAIRNDKTQRDARMGTVLGSSPQVRYSEPAGFTPQVRSTSPAGLLGILFSADRLIGQRHFLSWVKFIAVSCYFSCTNLTHF